VGTGARHSVTVGTLSLRPHSGFYVWMRLSYLWQDFVALRGKFGPLARLLKLTSMSEAYTPRKPADCQ
jgi:hypothetical protein